MFQEDAVRGFISACQKRLDDDIGPLTREAVSHCLAFWQKTLDKPYQEPVSVRYGRYVVIRVTHSTASDEWTNVGVMAFDMSGQGVFAKLGPFERAVVRGDLKGMSVPENYLERYPDLESVDISLSAMGHAMSRIQLTQPLGMVIDDEVFCSIYQSKVLGV